MAVKRISSEALIELALATVRVELMPALPPDKRYAAAMIANALEIARREVTNDAESPLWPLLDELYEPGEGNAAKLAADIRSGEVSEVKNPGLGTKLKAVLEAELAIANPRFLAARKG
jgi:hypothetical protein